MRLLGDPTYSTSFEVVLAEHSEAFPDWDREYDEQVSPSEASQTPLTSPATPRSADLRGCVADPTKPYQLAPQVLRFGCAPAAQGAAGQGQTNGGRGRVPMDREVADKMVLSNRGYYPLRFRVVVPSAGRPGGVRFSFAPAVGEVMPGESATIRVSTRVAYTATVSQSVGVVVSTQGTATPRQVIGEELTCLMSFKTERSMRLDPMALGEEDEDAMSGDRLVRRAWKGTRHVLTRLVPEVVNPDVLQRELALRQRLSSAPYVLRLLGTVTTPVHPSCFAVYESPKHGTLRSVVLAGGISDHLRMRIATDIARGLRCIHCAGIAHGRLCPDTVYVASRSSKAPEVCKVGDFWCVKEMPPLGPPSPFGVYADPSVTSGAVDQATVFGADVYSYGVTLLFLCSRRDATPQECQTLAKGSLSSLSKDGIPDPVLALVAKQACNPDAMRRPTFDEIVRTLEQTAAAGSHRRCSLPQCRDTPGRLASCSITSTLSNSSSPLPAREQVSLHTLTIPSEVS